MLDGSVTVDHRLLTEAGRKEIIQQQKDLPENLKKATQNLKNDVEKLALKLPDSKIQNKIITSLNQMVGGDMIAEAYKEFLKNGGTKEEFFVVADNAYAQQYIKDLADTNEKIKELESKGYSLEQILNTYITSVGDTNVISVKGEHNVTLTEGTTIGMQLLAASYGLSKSYSDFQQELNEKYGVAIDPETLSLVIGTILTGPAKTVANTLLSSQYGEYIQKAKDKSIDFVSTSITAISYGTNTNVISTYTNPELKDQISQESVETQEWSKSASERKEGAKFLTNIIAGIVIGGVEKGGAKGKDSDIDISKSGFEFEVGGAKKDAQGLYHDEKGRFTSDPNKIETDLIRPSLRAETKREINDRYHFTEDGKAIDLKTGQVIEPPHHYGHIYGSEHRRLAEAAEKVGMTQKQFNDYVNSRPDKFKIENATENLSHKGEKPGRGELKEILDDMQLFLKGRDK
ncbi:GH-E family nuclease [Acinetobacter sp.]|uniref:GH-E family nuclease n=1 Tax=Acinetobacter sp. TaxID=472 RepID=UPI00388FFDDF